MTMVAMTWSCYFPWRPYHDNDISHDDHVMISPWSEHAEYETPWSYHVIAWSSCLTMAVNPGLLSQNFLHPLWKVFVITKNFWDSKQWKCLLKLTCLWIAFRPIEKPYDCSWLIFQTRAKKCQFSIFLGFSVTISSIRSDQFTSN